VSRDEPAYISVFSGAGGLDLGLELAGWRCAYASDIDENAVATLVANRGFRLGRRKAFSSAHIEQSDIRAISPREVLAKADLRRGSVPLLVGGPPCQSWSSAGHQHGFSDPRGKLFGDYINLASGIDARWLLLENVRGLLTARGADGEPGSALALIRKRLFRAGYQTAVSLLNAADYGVAQRRVRLFIIGFRAGDPPPFPTPTHAKETRSYKIVPWVTLGEILASLSDLDDGEIIRPNSGLAAQLAKVAPGSGVKSPGKSEVTRPNGHWGYKQGAFVADLTKSARTVTANAQQDWVRDAELGLRRLCPRECAAIQSFPTNWRFIGSRVTQYRLIGNAVPPLLAKHIGSSLRQILNNDDGIDASNQKKLLPLPQELLSAINYTKRDERANGASRRAAPSKRVSRLRISVARN